MRIYTMAIFYLEEFFKSASKKRFSAVATLVASMFYTNNFAKNSISKRAFDVVHGEMNFQQIVQSMK